MKVKLKETFSDASRHVPTKNEVIKTEDTFVTEDFIQVTIQHKYNRDKVIVEQNDNPFRPDYQ